MDSIDIKEAQVQLAKLVERAAQGEEIAIGKAGTPMAKLVPYTSEKQPRKPGAWRGKVTIHDDFDELPEDILAAFRGELP